MNNNLSPSLSLSSISPKSKYPTCKKVYYEPNLLEKLNLDRDNDKSPIDKIEALRLIDSLYERGLSSDRFLIYGSIAKDLQDIEHKILFGDIDIAVAHNMPELAHTEFERFLEQLQCIYTKTGNTYSIIQDKDKNSFINIQLVTKDEVSAYPRSIIEKKYAYFTKDSYDIVKYNDKSYYCVKKESLLDNKLPLFINDNKYSNKSYDVTKFSSDIEEKAQNSGGNINTPLKITSNFFV